MTNGGDGSAWTADTLRVYVNAQLAELRSEITVLRREVDTSGEATAAVRDALLNQVAARFEAINAAVGRAEQVNDKRFELINQFRNQLTADARFLMTRKEVEAMHAQLADKIGDVDDRLTRAEGRVQGASVLWSYLVGGIGLVLAIIAAILAYTNNQKINEQERSAGLIAPIVQVADPVRTGSLVGW